MIPEAAVDAALKSVFSTSDLAREVWAATIRDILEAAAPHMLAEFSAQVWDEAMTRAAEIAWEHDGSASSALKTTPNPYRTAT